MSYVFPEEVLDKELPICDSHHHLWTHRGTYLLPNFLSDIGSGHNIVASVLVECGAMYSEDGAPELRPLGETEFAARIAREAEKTSAIRIGAGIVGHADLTLGYDIARVLEAHLEIEPARFQGIRHSLAWDPSPALHTSFPAQPDWMFDSRFRAGFSCLEQYGLSFDAWIFHPQLPALTALATAFPRVTVILDHVGGLLGIGPYRGRGDDIFNRWKRDMAKLAERPNVFVKLGGLGMPRCGFGWEERDTRPSFIELSEATKPYYLTCIDLFGPDRCMFESNFPVDKVSYDYRTVWNAFKHMSRDFSPGERSSLFHDTAIRAYNLFDRKQERQPVPVRQG